MRLDDALGRACRARRVDDGRDVAAIDGGDPLVHPCHRCGVASPHAPQIRERHDVFARGGALDEDDLVHLHVGVAFVVERDAGGDRLPHLGECLLPVAKDKTRIRVAQDVAGLVGKVRLVDRDRHAPRRLDAEIGFEPFRTGPGEDRGPLPRFEAERDQPGRDLAHGRLHVAPRELLPGAFAKHPVARLVSVASGPTEEHLRQAPQRLGLRLFHARLSPSASG